MKTNKNIIIIILITVLLVMLTACDSFQETESSATEAVVTIDKSVVSATGILLPEQYAYLSAPSAGLVAEVLVVEGQSVTKGQNLIVLGDLALVEAGLAAAEFEYEAAQQALDGLHESADMARAAAWLTLLDARAQHNAAEEAWDKLDMDDIQGDIDDAREDILEAEEDLEDAQEKFDRYADLDEENTMRIKYEDQLEESQEDYNEKARDLDKLIIELERVEANFEAALAALEKTQTDYEAILSGPNPDLLALAEARLANAKAQIEAAQAQVDNMTLVAPFAGIVVEINIHAGEWAGPGQPVVVLADLNSLRIETTDLNEIDVVQFDVGDMAEVTFDAISGQVFEGTVTEISHKASEGYGVNYAVIIELNEIPEKAKWGMTVFVDIDLEQ